ncbi:MAG TPA: hypothetical protein VF188_03145 [Longimicrobiales bacterium]
MKRLALLLALPFVLPACDLSVDPPKQTIWEATLHGDPAHAELTGHAAAISYSDRTEASVSVSHAPDETTLAWRIQGGSCAAPGAPVGSSASYPPLHTDSTGAASANVLLSPILVSGQDYHVAVATAEEDAIACGALVER